MSGLVQIKKLRNAAEWLRAVIGSLAAGGALQIVVAASGILASRLLGVSGRGHLALLWVATLVVGQLSTVGVHVGISYAIAQGENPRGTIYKLRRVIALQLLGTTVIAVPVQWAVLSGFPGTDDRLILATAFVPAVFVLLLYGLAVTQGEQRYRSLQMHRLVQPALYVVVLLILDITNSADLRSVTLWWAITMIIGGLFAWRQALGVWLPQSSDAAELTEISDEAPMLRFSTRAMFSAFGVVEHLQFDQLLAGILLSAHEFGFYTAGSAFANLPEFTGQSVGYVAYPEVARAAPEQRFRVIARFVAVGAAVLVPMTIVLVLAVPWLLPHLLGSSFGAGSTVAQLLVLAAFVQGIRRVAAEGLRGLGSGVSAAYAELSFVVVFVALMISLTGTLHAKGAGLSFLGAALAALVALPLLARTLGHRSRSSRSISATDVQVGVDALSAPPPQDVPTP